MTTCVVLAGGLGTRLRPVLSDRPKCLAPVGETTFLALQMQALAERGATRFVLALGYLAQDVIREVEPLRSRYAIETVVEPQALGTGGAVLHAMGQAGLEECLATNGDTWLDADIAPMLEPLDREAEEWMRLACVEVPDASRYGTLQVAQDGRVAGFAPRGTSGPALINAGLYRLHRAVFGGRQPGEAFSLESDVLPALAGAGTLFARRLSGAFIDIGVPDDYQRFCAQHA